MTNSNDRAADSALLDSPGARRSVADARAALDRFVPWLDTFGERSQDPYDFLVSPIGSRTKKLYHRHRAGVLAAAPFVALDILAPRSRRIFRKPDRYPIADAHYAAGFLALGAAKDDPVAVRRGLGYLDALDATRSPGYDYPAWGYPFDWQTRYDVFRANWPLITTIPYCYEAYELGLEATGDERHLATMEAIAEGVAELFHPRPAGEDAESASYTPFDDRQVINAAAYRGVLLVRAGARFGRHDWAEAGARNIRFVVQSQSPDGSWRYSVDGTDDFVDNFHTCFVLKSLVKAWQTSGDDDTREAIRRGYGYYLDRLIDAQGLPVPYAVAPRMAFHRRDLYDFAEGINLARLLLPLERDAAAVLERLVAELVGRWQLPDGHFVTRELRVGRNTVPYHRWAQSQTFHALARLAAEA